MIVPHPALMAAFQFDTLCLEYSRSIENELKKFSSSSSSGKLLQLNTGLNSQSAETIIKKMKETIAATGEGCYDDVSSHLSRLADYARLLRQFAT